MDKIIREHLPEKVGEELRQVLEEHGELKERVEALTELAEGRMQRVSDLERELNQHKIMDNRVDELVAQEKALEEAKRNLEVNLLKIDLASAVRFGEKLEAFMLGLSRNLSFRRVFMGEVPVGLEKHEHSSAQPVKVDVTQTTEGEAV